MNHSLLERFQEGIVKKLANNQGYKIRLRLLRIFIRNKIISGYLSTFLPDG
jgi:hypothetical protein